MDSKRLEVVEASYQEWVDRARPKLVVPGETDPAEMEAYYHIVLSGIGGSGKTSVLRYLEELGFNVLPTVTTRPRRNSDGRDRVNVSPEEFHQRVEKNEFAFWQVTNGYYQGFPTENLRALRGFVPTIVDKSIPSVLKIKEALPQFALERIAFVYLMRPSVWSNFESLSERDHIHESDFRRRTTEELNELPYLYSDEGHHYVWNDDLELTCKWFGGAFAKKVNAKPVQPSCEVPNLDGY